MRIAKALARAGLCSRREAERWIEAGRVCVNGEVLRSPARDVAPADQILVDGKPLPAADLPRLWRYYKPKGRVTTHRDPQGRPTVFEALPAILSGCDDDVVKTIGRSFRKRGIDVKAGAVWNDSLSKVLLNREYSDRHCHIE